jgi:dynein regulatory complex subunit 7
MSSSNVVCLHSELKAETKKVKLLSEKVSATHEWPKATSRLSRHEIDALEYVENYRRDFFRLFPHRKALPLVFKNEDEVQKFACTSLRPSTLPFIKQYDIEQCAEFVADYITFQPLLFPCKIPDHLFSPSTTLSLRAGDSLEMANVLASLLRGIAYDAYVVFGHAPKWVTEHDLSGLVWKGYEKWLGGADGNAPVEHEADENTANKAALPFVECKGLECVAGVATDTPSDDFTNFIKKADAKSSTLDAAATADADAGTDTNADASNKNDNESGANGTVDGDSESVDNKTGDSTSDANNNTASEPEVEIDHLDMVETPVKKEKYAIYEPKARVSQFLLREKARISAEALEKKKNQGKPSPDSGVGTPPSRDKLNGQRVHAWVLVRAGPRGVKHDVFVEPSTGMIVCPAHSPYQTIEAVWNDKNYFVNLDASTPANEVSLDLDNVDKWEFIFVKDTDDNGNADGDISNANAADDSAAEAKSSESKEAAHAAQHAEHPDTAETDEASKEVLDLPLSWAPLIQLDHSQMARRFPNGSKTVKFHRCIINKYCEFDQERQGCVQQVVLYADNACSSPLIIREEFAHRKDKLEWRMTHVAQGRVHEHFAAGRPSGLKEFIEVKGERRLYKFHPNSRVDNMVVREEVIGVKVVELYENRDDRLKFRSIAVDSSTYINPTRQKGFSIALAGQTELPVRKITEKYAHNEAIDCEHDVRKRTHFIAEGQIRIDYHFGKNQITASRELFDKASETCTGYRVDPEWKKESSNQIKVRLQQLLLIEKSLVSKVKDRERDLSELLDVIQHEQASVKLERSMYDMTSSHVAQSGSASKANEQSSAGGDQIDYLSPFLAQFPTGKLLTRKQALLAREDCLNSLKERLLERANIIQNHLESENELLKQKQAMHNRAAGAGDADKQTDEEFAQFYEETMFRISILQARLARHEELALRKYAELDSKLRQDPRLSALRK